MNPCPDPLAKDRLLLSNQVTKTVRRPYTYSMNRSRDSHSLNVTLVWEQLKQDHPHVKTSSAPILWSSYYSYRGWRVRKFYILARGPGKGLLVARRPELKSPVERNAD